MNQLIEVHSLFNNARVANVCLDLQRLKGVKPPPCRLGIVAWRACYPEVGCELYDSPIRAYRRLRTFLFVPEFPVSIVSREIAEHFQLTVFGGVSLYAPIPLAHFAGLSAAPISARLVANTRIDFAGTGSVEPKPVASEEFLFWVSDNVSPDFAILGRNVMDKLLVLYRGYSYDHLPPRPAPPYGNVYFGADAPDLM